MQISNCYLRSKQIALALNYNMLVNISIRFYGISIRCIFVYFGVILKKSVSGAKRAGQNGPPITHAKAMVSDEFSLVPSNDFIFSLICLTSNAVLYIFDYLFIFFSNNSGMRFFYQFQKKSVQIYFISLQNE